MLTTDVSIIRTATGTREKQRAPTSSSSPSTGPAALGGLTDWGGRIVVDANNPIEAPLFKPVDLKGARLCKAVQKKKGT